MSNKTKFVSIIVPCRNEEKYIGKCLGSLLSQDYPKEKMEILFIDGMSEDKTREIVKKYIKKYSFISNAKREKQGPTKQVLIKLLDNFKKYTTSAFNLGIKEAKGEIIMFLGAHAGYERDYISKCVRYLKECGADNVGGVIQTLPSRNTLCAKAIALSLSHPFGVGGSYFRTMGGNKVLPSETRHGSYFRTGVKEPKEVDTVFGGCYKKEVFEKIGLFNENLIRSQDIEFNLRLKRAGGKILLVPDIVIYYYPKSNLKDFFFHNLKDGLWSIYPLKFVKIPFSFRHYIPLIFLLSLLITGLLGIFLPVFSPLFWLIIGLYLLLTFCFSIQISLQEKDIRFLLFMPLAFTARHIGYGLGSIWGLIKLI